jgi:hypothetical protein
MIEIAFSLAIVAFALVAIMGVLPTGMTVQKDNREDTLINNDGFFWAEALRSGSRGIYDLTNYVEEITISNGRGTSTWSNTWDASSQIVSSEQIIGLLCTPKYQLTNNNTVTLTNIVTARVRAINGPAIDMKNPRGNEFVFRYQLESEVTSVVAAPVYTPGRDMFEKYKFWSDYGSVDIPAYASVATNLHNLRLTLRWPVFEQGNTWGTGRNRRTVRALAGGQVTATLVDEVEGRTNYAVPRPNNFQYVSIDELPQ